MMTATALERSIAINAPRDRVWQAITDPDQLAKWFVPNLPGAELKLQNGTVTVYLYGMGVDFLTLEIAEAARKVVIHSLPEHLLTTTYTLEDQAGGTLVKVALTGFERLPENTGEDRFEFIGAGWDKALSNLKAFVDGVDLPHSSGFIGSLFGYWRKPESKLGVERSIWINGSREKVWKALVDPKQIQQWYSPTTEWQLSALEVGGKYYVQDEETSREKYVEIIEILDPPSQLVTRCLPETDDMPVTTKMFTLTEENGGTRLTLTYTGYEQESDATRWSRMEENGFGFGMMLQNTKAYVEGKDLPFPHGF